MIDKYKSQIMEQLGGQAWMEISQGAPKKKGGYLYFWLLGHECSWGIDTEPPLLMHNETGKEFSDFQSLYDELIPTIPF